MSNWNGKHGKGAGRIRRVVKREEAEARQIACTDGGVNREANHRKRTAEVERIERAQASWRPDDGEPPNIDDMGNQKSCTCLASIRLRSVCVCN